MSEIQLAELSNSDSAANADSATNSNPDAKTDPNSDSKLHCGTTQRDKKLEIVKDFIKKNCNLAPQGSVEWLKTRQSIIGGSELSVLNGKNPFTNIADLVANKCNLTGFSGNVATKWGNIFEEITRIIIQMLFLPDIPLSEECIFETGSLEGVIPHHRFSPDGLTVLTYREISGAVRALITLLEFKSPLSSIPTGIIPPYYLPQVKAGMCDVDMTEIGLFVNNMFRKCGLDQFGNNRLYNTSFHFSDIKKNTVIRDPLAIGIIGLYQTKEQLDKFKKMKTYVANNKNSDTDEETTEDEQNTLDWQIINKMIDVGNLNEADTLVIFQYISKKYITLKYFPPNIYTSRIKKYVPSDLICVDHDIISYASYDESPKKFIKTFKKKCKQANCNPVGYIPWKLFTSDLILVDKEPLYIYQFVPKIEEVIKIVAELCKIENMADRRTKYIEFFPKNKLNYRR